MSKLISAALSGRITGPTTLPAGSTIIAADVSDMRRQVRTEPDAKGDYHLDLPEGTYDLMIHAPGYLLEFLGGLTVSGPVAVDRRLSAVAQTATTRVTGTLLTSDGRPAAGWRLTPTRPQINKQLAPALPEPATTNAAGEFTMELSADQCLLLGCTDARGNDGGTLILPVPSEGTHANITVGGTATRRIPQAPPQRASQAPSPGAPGLSNDSFAACLGNFDMLRLFNGVLPSTPQSQESYLAVDSSVGAPQLVGIWLVDGSVPGGPPGAPPPAVHTLILDRTGLYTPYNVVHAPGSIYTVYNASGGSTVLSAFLPIWQKIELPASYPAIVKIELPSRPSGWWVYSPGC